MLHPRPGPQGRVLPSSDDRALKQLPKTLISIDVGTTLPLQEAPQPQPVASAPQPVAAAQEACIAAQGVAQPAAQAPPPLAKPAAPAGPLPLSAAPQVGPFWCLSLAFAGYFEGDWMCSLPGAAFCRRGHTVQAANAPRPSAASWLHLPHPVYVLNNPVV